VTSLVFLHGVGGGPAAWERQLPYFAARGYEVDAWAQPGYGGTPAVEPYDLEHVARELKDWIGHRAPAVLVGHSMGGFVAQEACARFPGLVRALVLCFTSPAFGGTGSDFAREFIQSRIGPLDEGVSMAQLAARLMPAMRGSRSEEAGAALAGRTMAAVPAETYRKAVRLLTTFDRRDDLARIAVPALLLAGSDDRTAPPGVMERMARKIPASEYVVLQGCGHLGPMDQPDAFNAALLEFLKRRSL
jgi:3-oxoadipate enol-lactonase